MIEEYKDIDGRLVEVDYDESGTSWNDPRNNDNVGNMYCWHGRLDLGDHKPEGADMYANDLPEGSLVIWLYLIDHSGISMRAGGHSRSDGNPFNDPWDSGCVGYIFATPEDIQREWAGDYELAESCLRSEVEEYDMYLRGEVYYFQVYDLIECQACETVKKVETGEGYGGILGTDSLKELLPERAEGEFSNLA